MAKTKATARVPEAAPAQDAHLDSAAMDTEQTVVRTSLIDISPLNYRQYYSSQAVEGLATDFQERGIATPLTVRPMPSGRYELVGSELPFWAAQLAGLTEVPATIKALTDQAVREALLQQHIHGRDAHPLHEAIAIQHMLDDGRPIEEIATRLKKTHEFIRARLRLISLIDPLQDMLLADALRVEDALEITTLSIAAQTAFYGAQCEGWEEEGFKVDDLPLKLSPYRNSLQEAPFDVHDAALLRDAGACTSCPFNSATLTDLFPALAAAPVCSSPACYERKSVQHVANALTQVLQDAQADAVLVYEWGDEPLRARIARIANEASVPVLHSAEVLIVATPLAPETYEYEYEDDGVLTLDADAYAEAVEEYRRDFDEHNAKLQNGTYERGVLFNGSAWEVVGYIVGSFSRRAATPARMTTKFVDEAIKSKTATPEMLEAAISRIYAVEERAKELDREKVQEAMHDAFRSSLSEIGALTPLAADTVVARLLVYQSLGYAAHATISQALFRDEWQPSVSTATTLLERLAALTDEQHCYLLRMALASTPESIQPGSAAAACLSQVAQEAGVDLRKIQHLQDEKAESRWEKKELRIWQLQKLQQKLQRKQAEASAPGAS